MIFTILSVAGNLQNTTVLLKSQFLFFQIIDIIAKGAFGNVVKVRREDDKQFYAMKVTLMYIFLLWFMKYVYILLYYKSFC